MRLPTISVAQATRVLRLLAMGQTLAALYLVVKSACFTSLDVRSDHLWAVTLGGSAPSAKDATSRRVARTARTESTDQCD